VAVFGPSNIKAWGPYTPPGEESVHTVVSRDLPCMPCFYRGHSLGLREGCGTRECLTLLAPKPVLDACRGALDRRSSANGSEKGKGDHILRSDLTDTVPSGQREGGSG
jgi:heptosyltransferase-2